MEKERIPAWSNLAEPGLEEATEPVESKETQPAPAKTTAGVGFGNTKRTVRRGGGGWGSKS